jgi:hypothetical protein
MSVRLFHPTHAALRLATVTLQPASPGHVCVAIARGASRYAWTDSRLLGPFPASEGASWLAAAVDELKAAGYLAGGSGPLVHTVQTSKKPRHRAHAAERLGWRRDTSAVDVLRARAQQPKDDISSVVLALGRIGDPRALPELEAEANKKLLSRRRAASEAIRLLGDPNALAAVEALAKERLADLGLTEFSTATALSTQLAALSKSKAGPAIDALYDLGTEPAVDAVRGWLLANPYTTPGTWRFAKSVLKRSMARIDAPTFALLMRGIELQGRVAKGGVTTTLKSGLDGETRSTRVFSARTADWLRRAAWRFCTAIGRHRPERYPEVAAAVLVLANDADDVPPKGKVPASGHSYLLMRALYGGGTRYTVERHRPVHRANEKFASGGKSREEAFAELWDSDAAVASIRAMLAFGEHRLVQGFALRLAEGRPAVLDGASTPELVAMLRHPSLWDPITLRLRARLERMPLDTVALTALASSEHDAARALAASVITVTAHRWVRHDATALALLLAPAALREAAARLVRAAAPSLPAEVRSALVRRVVQALDQPLPQTVEGVDEGAFDGLVEVLDVFAVDLLGLVDVEVARRLLGRHAAGAAVAAIVIGRRADALDVLGPAEVLRLGQLPDASSRTVVAAMMGSGPAAFGSSFGLLLELVEGEWEDVRTAGVAVLQRMEAALLPPDGPPDVDRILAIVDSTWPAVQAQGRRFVRALLEQNQAGPSLTAHLLGCLAQHPHASIRSFVLALAEGMLGAGDGAPGPDGLRQLEPVLRATLFDVRPSVPLRRRAVAFVVRRGLEDPVQAEVATRLLASVVRSRTHTLRDDALAGLAELVLTYPSARACAEADGIVVAQPSEVT